MHSYTAWVGGVGRRGMYGSRDPALPTALSLAQRINHQKCVRTIAKVGCTLGGIILEIAVYPLSQLVDVL